MSSPRKNIIAFGYHDTEIARNWVVRKGLKDHGYTLLQCRTERKGFFPKCRELSRAYRTMKHESDIVLLPFLGQYMVPLAWLLTRFQKKRLILDAFLSVYDTYVDDRKTIAWWHPYAMALWLIEFFSCHLSNVILLDTEEHKQYFVKKYHVNPKKILVLPIGSNTDIFRAVDEDLPEQFTVEFHGTFIPLQGIETILKAAHILEQTNEQIHFDVIGRGQTYKEMRALAEELTLTSVTFHDFLPITEINAKMHRAHVCLGIFGITEKADRVIPTKAYEILLVGRPLITGRTTAAKRILKDRENVVLSEPGNPKELAERIMELKNNPELRSLIARNGHTLSLEQFQPKAIVSELITWLRKFSSPA